MAPSPPGCPALDDLHGSRALNGGIRLRQPAVDMRRSHSPGDSHRSLATTIALHGGDRAAISKVCWSLPKV